MVIAPGFGESPRIFQRLTTCLTGAGYTVIRLWSHRWSNLRIDRAWKAENAIHPDRPFPKAQYRLAYGVIRQLEGLAARKVEGVGHSMAGIYLLIAAYLRPELFKAVYLVAPAGLLEGDSFWNVFRRVNDKSVRNFQLSKGRPELRRWAWVSLREGWRYSLLNPSRSLQEGLSAATYTVDWLIGEVRKHIPVYGLLASDDNVYPAPETHEQIERLNKLFTDWELVEGPHDLWLYHERLADWLLALTALFEPAPEEDTPA